MPGGIAGMPASPGIVDGPVHLLRWEVPDVRHRNIPDEAVPAEIERLHAGIEKAKERLRHVRARAEKHAGPEEAAIFDVQITILEDEELQRQVVELVQQNIAAEKAFDLVMFEWRQEFAGHARPMIRERVGDLIDVQIRVLSILLGLPDHDPVDLPKGANKILVTHDLTPSLTVQLDREAIIGIATDAGTRTSHVAILARSLGLPAVVGLRDATERLDGTEHVILDGTSGVLIINPTPAQLTKYRERRALEDADALELQSLATADSVTLDGHWVTLRANVDLPEEAEYAARSGAEGVGLMRTEFLVVGRATPPGEEEQYAAYRKVAEAFPGQPVVIRTFDLGGDKFPAFLHIGREENPFLGWRAIRVCLDEPEIFRTQLRALGRALQHGDIRIMLPLINEISEVERSRVLMKQCLGELRAEGYDVPQEFKLGAMIETPAAAMLAPELAGHVDFFSIGTNDLVQYTLAVDRGNSRLARLYNPFHPAVVRLLDVITRAGNDAGIEVSVCGEFAANPVGAFLLIGMKATSLSVAPSSLAEIKKVIRSVTYAEARTAVDEALRASTPDELAMGVTERLGRMIDLGKFNGGHSLSGA